MNKRHGFKHIPSLRRKAWEPILNKMGPGWTLLADRPQPRTMKAMTKEVVAVFTDVAGLTFGKLTPAGMALRDAWIRSAMLKYHREHPVKKKPKGPRWHSGK